MASITLDVAYDSRIESLNEVLNRLATHAQRHAEYEADARGATEEACGVTHEVLDPCGPACGWPVVKFTGPRSAMEWLAREWAGQDENAEPEDVAFWEGQIQE